MEAKLRRLIRYNIKMERQAIKDYAVLYKTAVKVQDKPLAKLALHIRGEEQEHLVELRKALK